MFVYLYEFLYLCVCVVFSFESSQTFLLGLELGHWYFKNSTGTYTVQPTVRTFNLVASKLLLQVNILFPLEERRVY